MTLATSLKRIGTAAFAVLLTVVMSAAQAQACTSEAEPNDTPLEATSVSDSACVVGELSGGDQDIYVWTIAGDRDGRWLSFELVGLPDGLTTVRLLRLDLDDQGLALAQEELFSLSSTDGATAASEFGPVAPGTYHLGVSAAGGAGAYTVAMHTIESFDVAAEAVPLPASLGVGGAVPASGRAIFGFATDAPALYRVQALGDVQVLRYYGAGGVRLGEASGTAPLRLDGLALSAGEHYLEVRGAGEFILKVIEIGPVPIGVALIGATAPMPAPGPYGSGAAEPSGSPAREGGSAAVLGGPAADGACTAEAEPNDASGVAGTLMRAGCVTGRLAEGDRDDYLLTIAPDEADVPFRLEYEAFSPAIAFLSLEDERGGTMLYRYFDQEVTLPAMVLPAGAYVVSVASGDGVAVDYEIRLVAEGAIPEGFEREPNDRLENATPLGAGGIVQGSVAGDDVDVFLFTVEGEPRWWDFEAEGGVSGLAYLDASGRTYLNRSGLGGGESARMSGVLLLPGRHYLQVKGGDTTYTLRVVPHATLDGDPSARREAEPNDTPSLAEPLRFAEPRVGLLAEVDDLDVYRFTLSQAETIRLEVVPGAGSGVGALIDDDIGDSYHTALPDEVTVIVAELLPGEHLVHLRATQAGDRPYRILLTRQEPVVTPDLGVEIAVAAPEVAAYWHQGQRVTGTVTLTNRAGDAARVSLEARSSHHAWQPRLDRNMVDLPAGESAVVPVVVDVQPDARDDQPVRVRIDAHRSDGAATGAALEMTAVCEAPPIRPHGLWPVPAPLLGGIDVAWSGLGGRIVGEHRNGVEALIDGLVSPATGWSASAGESVTIALAGELPIEIAGFLLDPYGVTSAGEQLKRFDIALSTDGVAFETVHEGELSAVPVEQAIVLEGPKPARFARLTALRAHREDAYRIGLGAFKVVASPASPPPGGAALNLASPGIGGHVVWSTPLLVDAARVLGGTEDQPGFLHMLEAGELTWVIGFHNDRAARITALERAVATVGDGFEAIDDLEVAISLETPMGPWQALGTWRSSTTQFDLATPAWARFVRFTAPGLAGATAYRLPTGLSVVEQAADGDYASVIGEWGQGGRSAIYERRAPESEQHAVPEADGNDVRDTAQSLGGVWVQGSVALGEDVDWYSMLVPPGANTLDVVLEVGPSRSVWYQLVDAGGAAVATESSEVEGTMRLTATVAPGEYFLQIEEPPRSVVFAWDNSGSMTPFLDSIYRSVAGFVRDVDVRREVVQLLPFTGDPSGGFLVRDWSGDPLELLAALNDFDRSAASSDAEAGLLAASRALGQRPGARAVILMTDAESEGYDRTDELWETLAAVRPRVFALETSSAGSAGTQDLMQSWADAAGGFYAYTRSAADFEVAFARATCQLRRPVRYRVRVETSHRDPPTPGSISVTLADDAAPAAAAAAGLPAIEVILDASGSMYQTLGGETRIGLARRALLEMTTSVLPVGSPFALRVFGHREPNSCRTDLEIPLSPLDPAVVEALVPAIDPQLLSGTPLAESLRLAAVDLRGSEQGAMIVVLTDGEESCGGDVEEAIRHLAAEGIVTRLNIVGFSDMTEDVKTKLQGWAAAGGGGFHEAGDYRELEAGLRAALAVSFEVLDGEGLVVATGVVGSGPVRVPAGTYTVRVANEVFRDVRVASEAVVNVVLDGR